MGRRVIYIFVHDQGEESRETVREGCDTGDKHRGEGGGGEKM